MQEVFQTKCNGDVGLTPVGIPSLNAFLLNLIYEFTVRLVTNPTSLAIDYRTIRGHWRCAANKNATESSARHLLCDNCDKTIMVAVLVRPYPLIGLTDRLHYLGGDHDERSSFSAGFS